MTPRDDKVRLWVFACAALVFAVLARTLVLGQLHVFNDLLDLQLPMRWFYAQCLRAGTSFAWCPNLFCGFHFAGEGQCGPYHPLHLLAFRTLPFGFAAELDVLWPYPAMFGGCCLLLRRWLGRDGAAFGAFCFTFAGFNVLHLHHNSVTAAVAHLPWLLWCSDVALRGERRQAAWARFGITLLTASQLLLGHLQMVWISVLIELAFVLWLARAGPARAGRLAGIVAAKVLGLAGAGIQLAATWDYYQASARTAAADWYRNSFAVEGLRWMQLVNPYAFKDRLTADPTYEECSVYVGVAPLLLAVWFAGSRRRSERRLKVALVVLFGVALVLAMGRDGLLYAALRLVPVVRSFRCPARYFLLAQWAVAVAAGAGWRRLSRPGEFPRDDSSRSLRSVWVVVAASYATALAILAPRFLIGASSAHYDATWRVLLGPALFTVGGWLTARAVRSGRRAVLPLLLFTTVDLLVYAAGSPPHRLVAPVAKVLAPRPPAPLGEAYRVIGGPANLSLLSGTWQMGGYTGFPPAKRLDYADPRAWLAASVGAVRWDRSTAGYAGLDLRDLAEWLYADRRNAVWRTLNRAAVRLKPEGRVAGDWLMLDRPIPRFRLVARAVVSRNPAADLRSIDLRTTCLVEEPLALPPGAAGTVRVERDRPGDMVAVVDAPSRQLLCSGESWHRGWLASVDGRPVPVLRVNGDFFGCVVESGRHRVALEFTDPTLPAGRARSVSGLGLAVVMLLAGLLQACRRRGSAVS
ncbi:MAG: hypothetical protein HYU66_13135 [Armatimonadetes bacterium]|nr:hypothetical protein [Armatimonadota bacterium]